MKKRSYRPGGFNRSQRRRREYELAAISVEQEIIDFKTNVVGEPSITPSAIINESGEIFNEAATVRLGKIRHELDFRELNSRAKRAKEIKEILLLTPEEQKRHGYKKSIKKFLRRNLDRVARFARTAGRKGKVDPLMAMRIKDMQKAKNSELIG